MYKIYILKQIIRNTYITITMHMHIYNKSLDFPKYVYKKYYFNRKIKKGIWYL